MDSDFGLRSMFACLRSTACYHPLSPQTEARERYGSPICSSFQDGFDAWKCAFYRAGFEETWKGVSWYDLVGFNNSFMAVSYDCML